MADSHRPRLETLSSSRRPIRSFVSTSSVESSYLKRKDMPGYHLASWHSTTLKLHPASHSHRPSIGMGRLRRSFQWPNLLLQVYIYISAICSRGWRHEASTYLAFRALTEMSLFTFSIVPVTLDTTESSSTYVPCPLTISNASQPSKMAQRRTSWTPWR